jgi:V/A-type H+-transporting ATPase subunit I
LRIDVKKFLFGGPVSEKEAFFKRAQEFGTIHFINDEANLLKAVPEDVAALSAAIKILLGLPTSDQEETEDLALAVGIADKIIKHNQDLEKKAEEIRMIRLEIERVRIFGKFSKDDISFIEREGERKIQFFYAKQGFSQNPDLAQELIFVGSEHNLDYFIAINKAKVSYEHMIEMVIDQPYQMLASKEQAMIREVESIEKHLKTYAKYNRFLHHALIDKLNNYHLHEATSSAVTELNGELYFATGFVPQDKIGGMKALTEDMHVYTEEIAIDETDVIPTYLENSGAHKIGEDLVHIYDTPSHTDKDPSMWVLVAFACFFSMIIGDAGYGLVFLAAALYIRYKTGVLTGFKNRMWKLFLVLSCACIFWGTMSHSFFGIEMSVNSKFHKVSLLNWLAEKKAEYYLDHKDKTYDNWVKAFPKIKSAKTGEEVLQYGVKDLNGKQKFEVANKLNDGIMMEIALLVGIIHVTLSFLRYLDRNKTGIGWILFMIGCYLYFPSYLKTISMTNYIFGITVAEAANGGLILIYAGLGLAFLLAIIKNKLFGLLEVMNVIQVFGDILSYLRLYALGLAGAIVMATINDFAWSMNFILGPILFIIGHTINMALGIMGGVIHGLRLNFIEWYHYSFEGGGKRFNPLRKESIE